MLDANAKGRTILEEERTVEPVKLAELAQALGTPTASETAALVPFFGPTLAGEQRLAETLDMNFSRALLVGQAWRWERPFVAGERVTVRLFVEDVFFKGENSFALVVAEARDSVGTLVQEQR